MQLAPPTVDPTNKQVVNNFQGLSSFQNNNCQVNDGYFKLNLLAKKETFQQWPDIG